VRAGLVARAWDYRWSSAAYHVGAVKKDALVDGRVAENLIAEHDWKNLLEMDPSETAFLRRATRTGRPCGDNRFIARAEKRTGRRLRPLKPGPKPKKERR
jgi:putative transposase